MIARSVIFQPYRKSFPRFFFLGPERANNFICKKYDNLATDLRRRNDEARRTNDERNPNTQMTKERLDTLSSFGFRHSFVSRHSLFITTSGERNDDERRKSENDLKAQVHSSFMLLGRAWRIRWNFRRCIA